MSRITKAIFIILLISSASTLLGQNSIMSFNIRYENRIDGRYGWRWRKQKIVKKLKADAPDIIGLQEALITQIDYLEDHLDGYRWVGAGREDGALMGEFTPIFYRHDIFSLIDSQTLWLSETPTTPSMGWDSSHKRIATWAILEEQSTAERILFINTHFDHKGSKARTNSSHILISLTDSLCAKYNDLAVVIVGDFNAKINDISLRPLVDAYDYAITACTNFEECKAAATYIGFPNSGSKQKSIDHVFTRGLAVKSYVVDTENYGLGFLSDHRSIMCRIARLMRDEEQQ